MALSNVAESAQYAVTKVTESIDDAIMSKNDTMIGTIIGIVPVPIEIETLLYSSNAKAELKSDAGKEAIRLVGVKLLNTIPLNGKKIKKYSCNNTINDEINDESLDLLLKHLMQLKFYRAIPYILALKEKESNRSQDRNMEGSSQQEQLQSIAEALMTEIDCSGNKMRNTSKYRSSSIYGVSNDEVNVRKYMIFLNNATLLVMEEAIVLLKWSQDGFYYMVVAEKQELDEAVHIKGIAAAGKGKHVSLEDNSKSVLEAVCHTGLKNAFGNDISIIDVILEFPYIGDKDQKGKESTTMNDLSTPPSVPQQCESDPNDSSGPVVGEILPCDEWHHSM